MFPKSDSFYSTGCFKVLCEIWHNHYMYPFGVIAMKNGKKLHNTFLHVHISQKTFHLLEIGQPFGEKVLL